MASNEGVGADRATIEALRAACARAPDQPGPKIALARALLVARRPAEAVVPAEQAVALAPGLPAAAAVRADAIAALEGGDPALVRLELAAALRPHDADAQLTLADAYAALDRPHDAEIGYKAALALGRAADAHAGLAALYLSVGMLEAADHHAQAVLVAGAADDTLAAMACQTLAGVCAARGDAAGQAARLDQAYERQSLYRQPAAGAAFTTLVLVTRGQGNIDCRALMPTLSFDRAVWYMEHARVEQFAALPAHAVVLNAIGDADAARPSLLHVEAFLAQNRRPVLNPPPRVQATARDRLGETLAGVTDVIVPPAVRVRAGAVAAAGVEPPLLVRPAGAHGGVGLGLLADAAAIAAAKPDAGEAEVYVTAFCDTRSPDGFFRKYRAIYVDRRGFPYHLAISPNWMTHHQTSGMAGDAARMEEELAFLRDPAAAIGGRTWSAVERIGRRLDLDYAGLDFAVTADGQVLVFEANATMLTRLEPADGPFAAKNPFIRPIIQAFQARLTTLATG
jgi:tetratricopeptide (TPR) repeat protein